MPFNRPTINELYTRIKGDIEASIEQTTPILRKSVFNVFAKVFAGSIHLLFGFLDWLSRQLFPDTAEAEYLERWASIWNVTRKPSTFAEYDLNVTGSDGAVLPSGSIFQSVEEIEYATQAEITIAAGVGVVHVVASTSGSVGNLETGDELELVNPVAGIDSTAIVDDLNGLSGVDEESDEALRDRLLERIQNPPQGGSQADYIAWAKEVPGVTRAWCYPLWLGAGTVGIAFVVDDDPGGIIPDNAKVAEVQAYIDTLKPVTADATVFAPVAVEIDFTIAIEPDTSDIRAAVTAELTDLIFREGYPQGTLYLSQIREAVSGAAGEVDNTVSIPTGNIVIDQSEIAVMGTITWI